MIAVSTLMQAGLVVEVCKNNSGAVGADEISLYVMGWLCVGGSGGGGEWVCVSD
jgi:hypothetical protein